MYFSACMYISIQPGSCKRPRQLKNMFHVPVTNNTAIFSQSHCLQLLEGVYKLKPESDLTPIPGILKPQHHVADVEPDQS